MAMFRLGFDEARLLVIAELSGFWTVDTVNDYQRELTALMISVRRQHPFFHMLSRAAGMAVQSAEVSKAVAGFADELTTHCPGRIAITAGSVLNKMQASRALAHDRIRVFTDEDEALAWLASAPPPAAG